MRFSIISLICFILAAGSGHCANARERIAALGNAPRSAAWSISGKVTAVTYADSAKGTKSEIVVMDNQGKTGNIIILDTTTMYDEKGYAITRDKIAIGRNVKVKYTVSKTGILEARSIWLTLP